MALSPAFRETLDTPRRADEAGKNVLHGQTAGVSSACLAERAGIDRPGSGGTAGGTFARRQAYLRSVSGQDVVTLRGKPRSPRKRESESVVGGSSGSMHSRTVRRRACTGPTERAGCSRSRRHDHRIPPGRALYDRLESNWNELVAGANRAGLPLPLVCEGTTKLIDRCAGPRRTSATPLDRAPGTDRDCSITTARETAARSAVHDYFAAAERHVKACQPLQRQAESQGVHVSEVAGWPEWRHEAQRLEDCRQGDPCRRGYLRRLSRRRCRREAPRATGGRPVANKA